MITVIEKLVDKMAKKKHPNISSKFRLETAQFVVVQGYAHKESAEVMGVDLSTIGEWVK